MGGRGSGAGGNGSRRATGLGGGKMDIHEIAAEAFAVLGTGRQIAPFSDACLDFGLDDAYRVTAAVRAKREARGERRSAARSASPTGPSGPNTTSTRRYGAMSTTARSATSPRGGMDVSLSGLAEPRIEPEIVFGLAARARARAWTSGPCSAASTGSRTGSRSCSRSSRLDVSRRRHRRRLWPAWRVVDRAPPCGRRSLATTGSASSRAFEIDLFRNGVLADHGRAANVLDGPLFALRHLVELLAPTRSIRRSPQARS